MKHNLMSHVALHWKE